MIVVLVADGVSRCREGYAVVYHLSYPISCCIVAVIWAKGSIDGTAKHIQAIPRHDWEKRFIDMAVILLYDSLIMIQYISILAHILNPPFLYF